MKAVCLPPHLTYADLAHLTHEPEPFGGSVFVSTQRQVIAAATRDRSLRRAVPAVGGALAAIISAALEERGA